MEIRRAFEEEIPQIYEIWLAFMDYLRKINPDYYSLSSDNSSFSEFLKESIEKEERRIFIAAEEGEILGFLLAFIDTLPEWFGKEKLGLIRYLAVKEGHQQKGLGEDLLGHSLKWFKSEGIQRVELYVLEGIPASDFWKKQGFRKLMDRRFLLIP